MHTPKPHEYQLSWEWWRLFENQELAQMVENSFSHPFLRRIRYQLAELKALKESQRAKLFPSLALQGSKEFSLDADDESSKGYVLTLSVDFDPDFFAKNRDLLRSTAFEEDAKRLELIAAKNEWAAQVVKDYIGYCYQKRQIELLEKKIEVLEENRKVLYAYYLSGERGLNDYLVVDNEYVDAKEELGRSKLLLRLFADALEYETKRLPSCQKVADPALASMKLVDLEQRADLLAAKFTLLAAMKRYESVKKNVLPDLRLSSAFRMQDSTLANLLQSWIWSWGISLGVTLFDGGGLQAQHRVYKAKVLQRSMEYKDLLLRSIKDLKDTWQQIVRSQNRITHLRQKLKNQKEEQVVVRWRFLSQESGGADLLRVRSREIGLLIDELEAKGELLIAKVEYLKSVVIVKERR